MHLLYEFRPIDYSLIIYYLFNLLIISLVLVSCHRIFLMSNEDIKKTKILRFGVREWNFLAWFIKTGLIILLPYYLFSLIIEGIGITITFIDNILFIPLLYVFSRLSLVFPATAVGSKNTSFTDAWKLSQNNGWHLTFLVGFIPWCLGLAEELLFNLTDYHLVIDFIWLIIGLFELGLLSISYAYLKGYIEDTEE